MQQYQVAIIGGGPGGYETAIRLSQYEISCVVIEAERVGGVCLNWGCIPTKALVKSAELFRELKEAESYGLPVSDGLLDYSRVFERKNQIVEQLVSGIEFLFRKRRIPIIKDKATTIAKEGDLWKVDLAEGESISSEWIILATGSEPKSLPGIAIDEVNVLSSTGILKLDKLPSSLAVIGGGVIGCEFASIMNSFGVKVHIIEFLPRIVALEDEELSKRLALALKKAGIKITTGAGLTSALWSGDGMLLTLSDGSELMVDKVLMSVGRSPVMNIAWPQTAPQMERGAVVIDAWMRTSLPGIYAIGDVTAKLPLAHTASKQGLIVASHIHSQVSQQDFHLQALDYVNVPRCTFTDPELASVGYTEAEAKERFSDILVGKFPFSASGKALALGNSFGFVKTIARADTKALVGMHILGPNAAELIAQGAILISQGATAEAVESIVFAHPTLSEAVKESLEDIRNLSIHKI
ncbi:MAG: dihydrolipoyl dehydrogenase [Candidatus Cloacimonetes bacterium]|nr:dihydrolipoyl dehydrogenase [Candidatus Cloacimonadota bacterium]